MSRPDTPSDGAGEQDAITRFVRRKSGETLRSVAYVTADGYEFSYVRDDVREQYSGEMVDAIFDDLADEALEARSEESQYQLGALGCVVRCFAEGIVLNFPREEKPNLVLSMDPAAAARLHSFVGDCHRRLSDDP
ncbi:MULTISPECIES: DUF7522 family protein [Salinibaculum]|uniref:DUF7522 family protein n=1 Tax=Salinibaculum TaxID=2732368 RepID=UPI0030D34E9B